MESNFSFSQKKGIFSTLNLEVEICPYILNETINHFVERVIENSDAMIYAFGERWGLAGWRIIVPLPASGSLGWPILKHRSRNRDGHMCFKMTRGRAENALEQRKEV